MSLNRKIIFKSVILAALTAAFLYGFSSGPPPGFTGCFSEPDCTECHSEFAIDTGGGTFTVSSPPLVGSPDGYDLFHPMEGYVPEHPYTIVVTLGQAGQRVWGFELSARFEANGMQAGNFTVGAEGFTRLELGATGIQYISHTSAGSRMGVPDGPILWLFQWTAPRADQIPAGNRNIIFCGTGNAGNSDFSPGGDYIYTVSRTVAPLAGILPASDEENGDYNGVINEGKTNNGS